MGTTRRPKTIAFWRGRLPHWEVEDGRYFVTIHLAGAIPVSGRDRLRMLSNELSAATAGATRTLELQRMIFREMERWLDRTGPAEHLRQAKVAGMIVEAIEHRQRRRDWEMLAYVVMPSHIHLFCEVADAGLKRIIEDFKRWTAHRAAEILGRAGERFWQREWFDHWSRSDEEDEKIVRYIHNNPDKAGLVLPGGLWPYLR